MGVREIDGYRLESQAVPAEADSELFHAAIQITKLSDGVGRTLLLDQLSAAGRPLLEAHCRATEYLLCVTSVTDQGLFWEHSQE